MQVCLHQKVNKFVTQSYITALLFVMSDIFNSLINELTIIIVLKGAGE